MAMQEPSIPSVLLTVQTVTVCASAALLTAITLTPAAAASTITVYDNASAGSGTVLAYAGTPASVSTVVLKFDSPIYCKSGITAVVTGTGAQAQVYFQKEF